MFSYLLLTISLSTIALLYTVCLLFISSHQNENVIRPGAYMVNCLFYICMSRNCLKYELHIEHSMCVCMYVSLFFLFPIPIFPPALHPLPDPCCIFLNISSSEVKSYKIKKFSLQGHLCLHWNQIFCVGSLIQWRNIEEFHDQSNAWQIEISIDNFYFTQSKGLPCFCLFSSYTRKGQYL